MTDHANVCPPDHTHHATGTCYHMHKCRCEPCVNRANTYERTRRRLRAYGRWHAWVDAATTRDHLRTLAEAGIGHRRVAQITRMSAATIRDIRCGDVTRVRPTTALAILSIPLTVERAAGVFVDGRGTRRRIQALLAAGWSTATIATHMDWIPGNIYRLTRQTHVTHRTAETVATIYEALAYTPVTDPPRSIQRSRALAARNGWVPPMAWDDIDLDDEPFTTPLDEADAVVDVVAVDLVVRDHHPLRLSAIDRLEAVRQLHALHYFDHEIAALTGVSSKTIARDREQLGLPGVDVHARPHNVGFWSAA